MTFICYRAGSMSDAINQSHLREADRREHAMLRAEIMMPRRCNRLMASFKRMSDAVVSFMAMMSA